MIARRALFSHHLMGSGVELGPGHNPYPLDLPGIDVRYVDRWEPDANSELFPELGEEAAFPRPDIIANLDRDRLGALDDASVDFVIASHVLEHLADPIGILDAIHRVLRPGGVLLILLPDRHRTFDQFRDPTDLDHLTVEHEAGITEVDDAHIEAFLLATAPRDMPRSQYLSDDPDVRRGQIDVHRRRSVHVHCWDQDEFLPVLEFSIRSLGCRWEFVDAVLTEEGGPESIEFGFVVRKAIALLPPPVMADRFDRAWRAWREGHVGELARNPVGSMPPSDDHRHELEQLRQELAATRAELQSLRTTKTFRYTEAGRRAYGRLIR